MGIILSVLLIFIIILSAGMNQRRLTIEKEKELEALEQERQEEVVRLTREDKMTRMAADRVAFKEEREKRAKIEEERLAKIEQERLAKVEEERLFQAEKDRLVRVEAERVEKERLAEVERKRVASVKREETVASAAPTREGNVKGTHTFQATAYCSCNKCCGPNAKGITASGTQVTANRTIAVDPNVIPLGTKVNIEGYGTYIAEDTGSAVKGNIIDIYFSSHSEALKFGRRSIKVSY